MPPIAPEETRDQVKPASLELRIRPDSYDAETRTVEFVFSTGAAVRRWSWRHGEFDETLSLDPAHLRLDRINSGRAHLHEVHNTYAIDAVLGTIVEGSVRVEGGQLIGKVRFHETERSLELASRVQRGELTNVSLGYLTHTYEYTEHEGQTDERLAIDWEPYELSLVPIPADAGAHARSFGEIPQTCVVRRATGDTEEETMPPENEVDEKDGQRNAPASTVISGPSPEEVAKREAEMREAGAEAERKRAADIRAECRKLRLDDSFSDELVATGKPLADVRGQIIDHVASSNDDGGEIRSIVDVGVDEREKRNALVEAALLHRALPSEFPLPTAANGIRGLDLVEIGQFSQEVGGMVMPRGMARVDRAMALMNASVRSGLHGSSDFPIILANVAYKVLLQQFKESGRTYTPLVRRRPVPDFKDVNVTRVGEAPQLKKVARGAEYTYGTVGESGEKYAVLKYGKIFGVDWETLVDDDLDALTRMPQAFGRQAANLESDLFWEIFRTNPDVAGAPLFHPDHQNIGAGVIGIDGLNAGMVAMAKQMGLDGKTHLSIMPKHLIVPVALSTRAKQQVVLQTSPNETAQANPFQGDFNVIVEPRLDVTSSSEWYLSADPGDIDTIEMAYLQSHPEPFMERAEGFERDGTKFKIRHVVGFKAIEYRGLYKSTGA